MPFLNRVRLPIHITTPQFPIEATRFRLANGDKKTLSAVIRNTYILKTDYLNKEMHQRLVIALTHDTVNIEGDKYVGGVSLDSAYEIEWVDFLDYPLGQANATLEITPFDVTNTNCQTCDVLSQLSLVDDDIGELEAGATGEINVYSNDNICCFPPSAEIVSFNTTYLDDATIDEETGIVSLVVKADAFSVGSIVLATYRVLCPDGTYDDADVYGSISGETPDCEQPSPLTVLAEVGGTSAYADWTFPVVTPTGGFEWQLFRADTPGTPVDSGTTTDHFVEMTGLEPLTDYIFYVRSACEEGVYSPYTSGEFNTPDTDIEDCGSFSVIINDGTVENTPYSFSYMDCSGTLRDRIGRNLEEYTICMLMDAFNQPVYFESLEPYFTVTYTEPC